MKTSLKKVRKIKLRTFYDHPMYNKTMDRICICILFEIIQLLFYRLFSRLEDNDGNVMTIINNIRIGIELLSNFSFCYNHSCLNQNKFEIYQLSILVFNRLFFKRVIALLV